MIMAEYSANRVYAVMGADCTRETGGTEIKVFILLFTLFRHSREGGNLQHWITAFAGMTEGGD